MTNYNNTVTLIGNTGAEAEQHLTSVGKPFVSMSLYTQDSYKDDQDNWQQLPSVLHSVLAFSPRVMADLKAFKAGARLKIIGQIKYRPFEVVLDDGRVVKKYEATIIAKKVEQAALAKKHDAANTVIAVNNAETASA